MVSLTPDIDTNIATLKKQRIGVLAQACFAAAGESRRAAMLLERAEAEAALAHLHSEQRANALNALKDDYLGQSMSTTVDALMETV